MVVRANPGPFQYIAYEITVRGDAGVVSHVRAMMGRTDAVARTELLRLADVRRLFGWLRDQGLIDLPAVPPPADPTPAGARAGNAAAPRQDQLPGPRSSTVALFELSFRLGGREWTSWIADPFALAERRPARLVEIVRAVAVRAAGAIAYQPPSGPAGTQGYLTIDSVPSGEVSIDGVAIGETTPVLAYAVGPGSHTVRVDNKRLGVGKEARVKVQSGLLTSVDLALE